MLLEDSKFLKRRSSHGLAPAATPPHPPASTGGTVARQQTLADCRHAEAASPCLCRLASHILSPLETISFHLFLSQDEKKQKNKKPNFLVLLPLLTEVRLCPDAE